MRIIIAVISYLLGCIPAAYIVVKIAMGLDITKLGSGNAGALNSYEVTKKIWIGVLVLLLDIAKGLVAVTIGWYIWKGDGVVLFLAGLMVVIGHNYNIFLKLRGGRGLAAAAGVFCFFNPGAIILWGFIWLIVYFFIRRDVHIGNGIASFITPVVFFIIPDTVVGLFKGYGYPGADVFRIICAAILLVVILKHIEPIINALTIDS